MDQGRSSVSLTDIDIAVAIAHAAATGRGADRTPKLEQLIAAFGESEPTAAVRRRVAAAMAMTDITITPSIITAEPGSKLLLKPPRRRRRLAPVGLALLALVVLLGAAYTISSLVGGGTNAQNAVTLPPDIETATAVQTTTNSESATTTTTPPGKTTTAKERETTAEKKETKSSTNTESNKTSANKQRREKSAAARQPMSVRVDSNGTPTFLCVVNRDGEQLFNGMFNGSRTFRSSRLRLNIGLSSTRVTVNGRDVQLSGSPSGLDISRADGTRPLALGQRPCGR